VVIYEYKIIEKRWIYGLHSEIAIPLQTEKGWIDDLKILRDGYIVEVFVNGGEAVYTALL